MRNIINKTVGRKKPAQINPVLKTAIQYHQAGRLQEALPIYQQALQNQPDNSDILFSLAIITRQLDQFDIALEYINAAIALNNNHAGYCSLLGDIQHNLGETDKAVASLKKAITVNPRLPDPYIILGMIHKVRNEPDDAIHAYQSALKLNDNIAEVHNNLGNVYRQKHDLANAIRCYKKAIQLKPGFAGAHNNLGSILLENGQTDGALVYLRNASQIEPENNLFTTSLASCFAQVIVKETDNRLAGDLLRCMKLGRVDGGTLARNVNVYLQRFSPLQQFLQKPAAAIDHREILSDPLVIVYLNCEPVCDPALEKFFTEIRKELLGRFCKQQSIPDLPEEFLCALANQCFLNEYIYPETPDETGKLAQLHTKLEEDINDITGLLIYAAYRPLHLLIDINSIPNNVSQSVNEVFKRQIHEPEEEQQLKNEIAKLTDIKNITSHAVREQYEQNPYPKWLVTDHPAPVTLDQYLHSLFSWLPASVTQSSGELKILVAGCGTGLQPVRNAQLFQNASVTAFDLSLASLAYGKRKAEEYGLKNISFMQADILESGTLDEQYDFIECYGVLHHLQDPFAGWKNLVKLLIKGGVMRIGLYSEKARQAVVAARKLIDEKGYKPVINDIRQCRQDIFALPDNHPASVLSDSPDFYTASECRDLVFHVQEHRLDLPRISEYLDKLKLEFLGFEFPDFQTRLQYQKVFPEDVNAVDLSLWHKFEDAHPETFASQYVFWCRKL